MDSLKGPGVDFIKVHSATPRAAYFAILEEAARQGLLVAGHVPDSVAPLEAIRAGQRTIEHDWRIATANTPQGEAIGRRMLAGCSGSWTRLGGPKLWPYVMHRIAADDSARAVYDTATARAFAREAAGARSGSTPPWRCSTPRPGGTRSRSGSRRNSSTYRRKGSSSRTGCRRRSNPTEADIAEGRREYHGKLRRSGAGPGRGPVRGRHGYPGAPCRCRGSPAARAGAARGRRADALQAIAAATGNAAGRHGEGAGHRDHQAGKVADLVLLSADPLADIRNTRQITAVILRGRLLDRAALDGLLVQAEAQGRGAGNPDHSSEREPTRCSRPDAGLAAHDQALPRSRPAASTPEDDRHQDSRGDAPRDLRRGRRPGRAARGGAGPAWACARATGSPPSPGTPAGTSSSTSRCPAWARCSTR